MIFRMFGIRIPEIDHSFYQRGVVGDILHSLWRHSGHTVEIRSDSHVIRADQFHGVIDVTQQIAHPDLRKLRAVALLDRAFHLPATRILAVRSQHLCNLAVARFAHFREHGGGSGIEVRRIEVDPDHSAPPRQRAKHVVRHVARNIADRP